MGEKFDFIEQLQDSYIRHLEHIFKCGICASKLSEILREAQNHEPQLTKSRESI